MVRTSFFDKLPQELFTEICTRLPIKTIVHIRCVCKSWNALIKNPNFIKAHIGRTIADKKTQLLLRYHLQHHEEEHFSIRCDNETFDECMTFDGSYDVFFGRYYRIVGSCNGLICLSDDLGGSTSVVVVWNPAIRKTLHVPLPPSLLSGRPHNFVVGFGFNSWKSDFKVVRIVYFCDPKAYGVPPEVEVFEINTGLWRGSTAVVPPYRMIPRHWSHVFVKGASHWIAVERVKEHIRCLILLFDMGSEVFREMVLPASVANGPGLNMSISLFGESLSLFHYDGSLSDGSYRCCIWVMKEYGVVESWTKLFTLGGGISKVLGFRKTGEILVVKSNRELISFDPKRKQEVNFGIHSSKDSFHLDTYMQSLVFFDRKDQGLLNRSYRFHDRLKKGAFSGRKIEGETSVQNAEGSKKK